MKDKLFHSLKLLLDKYFPLILILIVFISFGQTLWMGVWEDDNALIFKLAHIQGEAGFLGGGILGVGPYKYTAFFYLPAYYIFGFNTFAFFAYGLCFLVLATFFVYKVFAQLINEDGGKLTGILFATGFIGSESFIRLFNSIPASVSIIMISLLLFCYNKFYQQKKLLWYFAALAAFLVVSELVKSRVHYLVSVVVLYELIFLSFQKFPKSLFLSTIRLAPFFGIFSLYLTIASDARSGQIIKLLTSIIRGEYYNFYSTIAAFYNLVFPSWFLGILVNVQSGFISLGFHVSNYARLIILIVLVLLIFLICKKSHWGKIRIFLLEALVIVWFLLYKILFTSLVNVLDEGQMLMIFIGGGFLILSTVFGFSLSKEFRKLYFFLYGWLILNIVAYTSYLPTATFESTHRYLTHSFLAMTGILGVLFAYYKNGFSKILMIMLVVGFGINNIINSVSSQHRILVERSIPVRKFYSEFKNSLPIIQKGDVFYFDVSDVTQKYFRNALAVSQMPETTALAWRYGVDRYDIKKFEDFEVFKDYIQEQNTHLTKIYTFFYSHEGLINTSTMMRNFLANGTKSESISIVPSQVSKVSLTSTSKGTKFTQSDIIVDLSEPINSIYPIELILNIKANLLDNKPLIFPIFLSETYKPNELDKNTDLKDNVFGYLKFKESTRKEANFLVSSEWQDRIGSKINDGDSRSIWQSNRLKWYLHKEEITIDLKTTREIDRLIWMNGYANQTPTRYYIEISRDGINWQKVKEITALKRIERQDLQIVKFDSVQARFIKMTITNTLNGDAPAIAEIWVVPSVFYMLDINQAEEFLANPFNFILNKEDFESTLSHVNFQGTVDIYWKSDKSNDWQTNFEAKINLIYDGITHEYKLKIPANGTKLSGLKLSNISIPGNLELQGLSISRSNLLAK